MNNGELLYLLQQCQYGDKKPALEARERIVAAFAELRQERDAAIDLHGLAIEKAQEWQGKCFVLQRERDLLREAVEAVEWIPDESEPRGRFCAWCGVNRIYDHYDNCLRQRALSAGKE